MKWSLNGATYIIRLGMVAGLLSLTVLLINLLSSGQVEATVADCGNDITYEKSADYDDSKISFEYEEDESWKSGYKRKISVTGNNGYTVKKVWLNVDNDGHSGYYLYANGPLNNFNPNPGDEINWAKVIIYKACVMPTPTRTCSPSPTLTPTPSPTPTDEPEPTPTETPEVTPEPTQEPEVTPEPTQEPEITPEPTQEPEFTPEPTEEPGRGGVSEDNKSTDLEVNGPDCDNHFTAKMTLKDNDSPLKDITVRFQYQDQVFQVVTNSEGSATANFTYTEKGDLKVEASGFETENREITGPEDCGEVLGISTYADTGSPYAILGLYTLGTTMIAGGLTAYARSKKQK